MTPVDIRDLRKRFGLTQAQLADLLHSTPSTVCRFEHDASLVRPDAWQEKLLVAMRDLPDDVDAGDLLRLGAAAVFSIALRRPAR